MKTLACLASLWLLASSQFSLASRVVAERGMHYRIIHELSTTTNSSGQSITRTNRFVELKNGACYLENGIWKDSESLIELAASGANGRRGPVRVDFLPNLNSANSIAITTPQGQKLQAAYSKLLQRAPSGGGNLVSCRCSIEWE